MIRFLLAWCGLSVSATALWAVARSGNPPVDPEPRRRVRPHIEGDNITDAEWVELVDHIWDNQ